MQRMSLFFVLICALTAGELRAQSPTRSTPGGVFQEQAIAATRPTSVTNPNSGASPFSVENRVTGTEVPSDSRSLELKKPSRSALELQAESSGVRGRTSSLFGTLFSLGLVVGLFLAFATVAQRYVVGKKEPPLPSEVIQVLGSIALPTQPKQQAILLKLGQRVLLLSNQSGQTRTLAEITDPSEIAQLMADLPSSK